MFFSGASSKSSVSLTRSPSSAFHPFFGEGSPTKINYTQKIGCPYSNVSNLEDLVRAGVSIMSFFPSPRVPQHAACGMQILSRNVQHIHATHFAFAAIRSDGRVISWGSADAGGDSSGVAELLQDVHAPWPAVFHWLK